jgi:cupin superfamily acireductone dioxygenase involved in methionine salvage
MSFEVSKEWWRTYTVLLFVAFILMSFIAHNLADQRNEYADLYFDEFSKNNVDYFGMGYFEMSKQDSLSYFITCENNDCILFLDSIVDFNGKLMQNNKIDKFNLKVSEKK